jgi:tRNA pseudouridine55 synthase
LKKFSKNRLFVAKKPINISSNQFLGKLKRKYGVKKAGYSGTLDPFASGSLIIAFGNYTKLFNYFKKTPKVYRATIWLGAKSNSLDIENIDSIDKILPLNEKDILSNIKKLIGKIEYTPPIFCAKKIDGKRAYELARAGKDVSLQKQTMDLIDMKLILYSHPFITFECSVSEGSYIRSLAQILLDSLNAVGTLSYLERLQEGIFYYEEEKELSPLKFLDIKENFLINSIDIENGQKILQDDLKIKSLGKYYIKFKDFFSIITIKENRVDYLLNRIQIC